jgi:hypothetical protein
MAIVQSILDDVKVRYKHTFTTDQVLVWGNEEQRELFEILELDSVPFSFSTVAGQYLYPIPNGVEKDRIKVITIQVGPATNPNFIELPFMENDNRQFARSWDYWYTILENNFYINFPSTPVDNMLIYIYLDQQPEAMSSTNLSIEPAVPLRYQELLKLGILKRIAAARKDTVMRNNYDAEYTDKLSQMQEKMSLQIPEYHTPIDTLPRANRLRNSRYDYRYFSN